MCVSIDISSSKQKRAGGLSWCCVHALRRAVCVLKEAENFGAWIVFSSCYSRAFLALLEPARVAFATESHGGGLIRGDWICLECSGTANKTRNSRIHGGSILWVCFKVHRRILKAHGLRWIFWITLRDVYSISTARICFCKFIHCFEFCD